MEDEAVRYLVEHTCHCHERTASRVFIIWSQSDDEHVNIGAAWLVPGSSGPTRMGNEETRTYNALSIQNCPFCGEMFPGGSFRLPGRTLDTAVRLSRDQGLSHGIEFLQSELALRSENEARFVLESALNLPPPDVSVPTASCSGTMAAIADLRIASAPSHGGTETVVETHPTLRRQREALVEVLAAFAVRRRDDVGLCIDECEGTLAWVPRQQLDTGLSLLHLAAGTGNVEIVQRLLNVGSDVNERDTAGWSLLHRAAREGMPDVVDLLLDRGAALEAMGGGARTWTPLHLAAAVGQTAAIERLVARGAELDKPDGLGRTALYIARLERHWEAIDLLQVLGANPNVPTDAEGRSPLHNAAARKDLFDAEVALRVGADHDARDQRGMTALHIAVEQDFRNLMDVLLDVGADPNLRDTVRGFTPLHHAASAGLVMAARILLSRGADPNVGDHRDQTPLHVAAAGGHGGVASLLTSEGAEIEAKDRDGRTAGDLAQMGDHTTVLEYVLKRRAKPSPG